MRAPIGIRIRNHRKTKGLSQVNLAKRVSISPSYLNLIEANKRDVGGTLLHKIAAELDIDLLELTGERETRLISELHEAFADPLFASLNLSADDAHILVAQLPKMARALHACFRSYLDANASANALSHRLKSDPLFSQLLHQMLSQITAIRSTTEILSDVPDISADKSRRFHITLSDESRALSNVAKSLIAQFDQEAEQHHSLTPLREVNDMIIGQANFFPDLETAANDLRKHLSISSPIGNDALQKLVESSPTNPAGPPGYNASENISRASQRFLLARKLVQTHCNSLLSRMTQDKRLSSPHAKSIAHGALTSYCAGAFLFPYDEFLQHAQNVAYDVDNLAQLYEASFEQIAHRLVTLRNPDHPGIPFGFLRADPSGFLTKQFPLPGLLMPNAGHACPLWAIYQSRQTPNQVIHQIATFADGSRYLFIAKTTSKPPQTFNDTPVYSSIMLACNLVHADKTIYANTIKLDKPELDTPVGPTCTLCTRENCKHRNSPMASPAKTIPL